MSVSNFRVIEGLDHSAESAPKRRKPITGKGRRNPGEARLPKVWISQHWTQAWDRVPRTFRQKDSFLPLHWSWVSLRTWNKLGLVGLLSFPYAIHYCQAALLIKPLLPKWWLQKRSANVQHSVEAQEERMEALPWDEEKPKHPDPGILGKVQSKED